MKYLYLVIICFFCFSCASTEVIEKTPKEKVDLFVEAEDYYKKGLLVQAEAKYRALLESNPNMYEAWLRLGNIHARTGQLEAAILAFEKCVEVAPQQVRGWNNLALVRVMQATEVVKEGLRVTDTKDVQQLKLIELFEKLIELNQI